MKLVLASKNKKKLVEMNDILSQLGIEVCSEAEAGVDVEVEETGTTFEENSLLKARAVMEASGLPAIADDSGLCVDALKTSVAAVSAGIVGEEPLLDLCYAEDSSAQVDLNCVMDDQGRLIEIQATGEGRPFTLDEQRKLVELCAGGIRELQAIHKEILGL